MIEIKALGPVAVTVDGGEPPPELLWRKHLALLIYLARSPRGTRARDHLLGLLWSDRPESAARHSLNEALRIIRRVAGPDALATSVDQVTLAPGHVRLDLDQVEADFASGDQAAAAGAIGGEFLEGFALPNATAFEDWLGAERRTWRGRGVLALVAKATERAQRGDGSGAVAHAERAVRLDPESEAAVRSLMEGLTLTGNLPAALAHYDQYRALLAERLGSVPSRELDQLAGRLRQSGSRSHRRQPPEPRPSSRRRSPLVGREPVVARLSDVWTAVRAGRAGAAFLLGDLGLGKTRLIQDLKARVLVDGGTVLVARMVEADRSTPWSGLVALARDGLADAPGAGGAAVESLAALIQFIPEWADHFPAAATATPTAIPRAVIDLLAAVAGEGPVVLALDDAEWCDQDSLECLESALRDLRERPLLVVCAAAPHPESPTLARIRSQIGGDIPGATVRLDPLSQTDLAALVGWSFPAYDAAARDRTTRRLAADSGGYPLLAIDLLDGVAAGLDLGQGQDAPSRTPWPRPAATLSQTRPGELPDSIIAAIRITFRRLSADAQLVLCAGSLFGGRIEPDALPAMIDLPADRVDAALDELEWTRWLAADARGYTFVARLTREIVNRDFVTGGQRRRWGSRLPGQPGGGGRGDLTIA